jgi:hypothetical protein
LRHALKNGGRRECRVHRPHPQPRMRMKKHTSVVTTGTPKQSGIPCTMVLTVSFVVSPETGLCCLRRRHKSIFADLTPASGHQDATTSPSASMHLVFAHRRVHRIPHPTFVTIAKRPSCECGMERTMLLIWGIAQRCMPETYWHDGQITVSDGNAVKRNYLVSRTRRVTK